MEPSSLLRVSQSLSKHDAAKAPISMRYGLTMVTPAVGTVSCYSAAHLKFELDLVSTSIMTLDLGTEAAT